MFVPRGLSGAALLKREKNPREAMRFPVLQLITTLPSPKGLLCQPLQGAEGFLKVFLLYFLLLSELVIQCKHSVWQTGFFAVIQATP